ncbi:hypothetical protein A9P82_10660 [Arachidicoccus ginsenosidimutans]|uniref:hypothetical protein n=1 Tax=Arachidicoccus sp. BS20 TaxID=1850526 RepID=UPI0007F0E7D9|nr:hypothetical protein [Arachidicoccus sp. BS20]ANI89709.1 hypothetical protein A9P82_10660 [Arachidicoccus sp. BS20]
MVNILSDIVDIINSFYQNESNDSFFLTVVSNNENIEILKNIKGCIEEIQDVEKNILAIDDVKIGATLSVELIKYQIQKFGYYDRIESFILNNKYSHPDEFYIKEINVFSNEKDRNDFLKNYFLLISLINNLESLAKFKLEDDNMILFIMQEKSAVELPLIYNHEAVISISQENRNYIEKFIDDLNRGYQERKIMYIKELIDFLNETNLSHRFEYLIKYFDVFYLQCKAAFEFFLSDFSYNKLKLEIENSLLNFSKNIRSIINDSQSRLIAIPAAFIVSYTQLDLIKALSLKNLFVIIASIIFSLLIEIFIRNQESALDILNDDINSYKETFKIRNASIINNENKTVDKIITDSFTKINSELSRQKCYLSFIRIVNWSISIFLVILLFCIWKNIISSKII